MEDREFASPGCYLSNSDFVMIPEAITEPHPRALCNRCKAVLSTCNDATQPQGPGISLNKLGFSILNFEGKVEWRLSLPDEYIYSTSDLLEDTAAKGCPLCRIFFDQLSVSESETLRKMGERNSVVAKYKFEGSTQRPGWMPLLSLTHYFAGKEVLHERLSLIANIAPCNVIDSTQTLRFLC